LLYLTSVLLVRDAQLALGVVIAGRLLSGITEAFIITSCLSWSLARLGPAHVGKVLGWIGVAMFAGLACGSPLGTAIFQQFGFSGVAVAVLVTAFVGLVGTSFIAHVAPSNLPQLPFHKVLGVVKLPGLGLTLCSMGYAMLTAFAVLLFVERGWEGGALAVTFMGIGFIVGRLLFGQLPDQLGGARVALVCVLVEAFGLALVWGAPMPVLAWVGAALAGGGYGLGFQSFGVEAVRRAPPQSRGSAMGAYVIFQDVSMGLAPPLGGLLAHAAGLDAVYLAAAAGALGAAMVAWVLGRKAA
jgi:predicted MFS family arabinose efflux permease